MAEPGMWDRSWHEVGRRLDLPLRGLGEIVELRRTLDRLERELVVGARRNRSTWEEIGIALGLSRPAAYARHGRSVKRADGA